MRQKFPGAVFTCPFGRLARIVRTGPGLAARIGSRSCGMSGSSLALARGFAGGLA